MLGFGSGAALGGVRAVQNWASTEVQNLAELSSDEGKGDSALYDPEFTAQTESIDNMQNWTHVASDDYVKNFPIADITEAYNNIINTVPSMRKPANRPALLSLVKRQLAQNRVIDPAEIQQLATIEKEIQTSRKTRRELDDKPHSAAKPVEHKPSQPFGGAYVDQIKNINMMPSDLLAGPIKEWQTAAEKAQQKRDQVRAKAEADIRYEAEQEQRKKDKAEADAAKATREQDILDQQKPEYITEDLRKEKARRIAMDILRDPSNVNQADAQYLTDMGYDVQKLINS